MSELTLPVLPETLIADVFDALGASRRDQGSFRVTCAAATRGYDVAVASGRRIGIAASLEPTLLCEQTVDGNAPQLCLGEMVSRVVGAVNGTHRPSVFFPHSCRRPPSDQSSTSKVNDVPPPLSLIVADDVCLHLQYKVGSFELASARAVLHRVPAAADMLIRDGIMWTSSVASPSAMLEIAPLAHRTVAQSNGKSLDEMLDASLDDYLTNDADLDRALEQLLLVERPVGLLRVVALPKLKSINPVSLGVTSVDRLVLVDSPAVATLAGQWYSGGSWEIDATRNVDLGSLTTITSIGSVGHLAAALEHIVLPPNLQILGPHCFVRTRQLRSLDLATQCPILIEIGDSFCESSAIEHVTFPVSLMRLGRSAFEDTDKLEVVDLRNTELGRVPPQFGRRSHLRRVTFPPSIKAVAGGVLTGATRFEVADFSECDQLRTVDGSFFAAAGVQRIAFPATLRSAGESFLGGLQRLRFVDLSHTEITEAGHHWFLGAVNLEEARLPLALTSIGTGCFRDCFKLKRLGVDGLRELTSIGAEFAANTRALSELRLAPGAPLNVVPPFFLAGSGVRTVALPHGVLEIGASAFSGCTELETMDLTECRHLLRIDTLVLVACPELKRIRLPAVDIESVGDNVARACHALAEIDVRGTSIRKIGDGCCELFQPGVDPAAREPRTPSGDDGRWCCAP